MYLQKMPKVPAFYLIFSQIFKFLWTFFIFFDRPHFFPVYLARRLLSIIFLTFLDLTPVFLTF